MEPFVIWTRIIDLIKKCYLQHIKETFSGVCMGFIGSQHLFWSGWMAHLVGPVWTIVKGVATLLFTFLSSLVTGYAGVIIAEWKERRDQKKSPNRKQKRRAA